MDIVKGIAKPLDESTRLYHEAQTPTLKLLASIEIYASMLTTLKEWQLSKREYCGTVFVFTPDDGANLQVIVTVNNGDCVDIALEAKHPNLSKTFNIHTKRFSANFSYSDLASFCRYYNGRNVICRIFDEACQQLNVFTTPVFEQIIDTINSNYDHKIVKIIGLSGPCQIELNDFSSPETKHIITFDGHKLISYYVPRSSDSNILSGRRNTVVPTVLAVLDLADPHTDPLQDIATLIKGLGI